LLQQAISQGLGVALVPALIAQHPVLQGLGFKPLAEPQVTRQVVVLRRPRRSLSPAAQVFRAAIVAQAAALCRYPGITPGG
jgi:DNA-binding transcriptional LysR family regulator